MTNSFNYRPKFTDMRIRKPMSISAKKQEEEIRPCEAEGCANPGKCKAPKSRNNPLDTWWFCEKHAAEYNKNWNFFEGMSDGDQRAFQEAERHGHRPTWNFGAKGGSREGATLGRNNRFAGGERVDMNSRAERKKRIDGKAQLAATIHVKRALEELGLKETATASEVRRTYADLVRRYHPDSNGGDRSAEARLSVVVKAYKVLKTSKRA